jgi:hypothetical protein
MSTTMCAPPSCLSHSPRPLPVALNSVSPYVSFSSCLPHTSTHPPLSLSLPLSPLSPLLSPASGHKKEFQVRCEEQSAVLLRVCGGRDQCGEGLPDGHHRGEEIQVRRRGPALRHARAAGRLGQPSLLLPPSPLSLPPSPGDRNLKTKATKSSTRSDRAGREDESGLCVLREGRGGGRCG